MNKLRKYSKILLIVFILAILSIVAPNIVSAYNDGDTTVVEQATNSTYTGQTFVITYNDLSGANGNTWYLMCNEHGTVFRNVRTLFTLVSRNDATPEEAYILSDLDTYNAKGYYTQTAGQNAWWNRGNYTTSGTTDTLYIQDLCMSFTTEGQQQIANLVSTGDIASDDTAAVRRTLRNIISSYGSGPATTENINELYNELLTVYSQTVSGLTAGSALSEEAKAFASYVTNPTFNRGITSYTINGITVNAPDLEMQTTLVDDDATVSFSEDDNSYVIGPFKLVYPEYGFTRDDGTYVMFSGLDETDLSLETNLGAMTYGTDWSIAYTSADAADVHGLPKSSSETNREFYIVLKYKPGMTQVTKLEFTYKYMNAGGVWSNYSGQMKQCTVTGEYYDYDKKCTFSSYTVHCGSENCGGHTRYECNICGTRGLTSTSHNCLQTVHAQNMAVLNRAVRWYTYQKITWEGEVPNFSSITVEKTIVDEDGERVRKNQTFYFDIYVDYHDGEGEQLFETLAVSTRNGVGSKTSSRIYWKNGIAPSYRVEERDKDGYSVDGPWSGTLSANRTLTISAENVAEPDKGRIEINKRLINSTPALESETFTFKIYAWGTFKYSGGSVQTYTSSSPLEITGTIQGAGTWESDLFEWYENSAPKYRVLEIIPDDAEYELVSSNNRTGTLKTNANTVPDSEIVNTPVFFINQPTTKWTYLHVDKKLYDGSEPLSGEEFTARVVITGDFTYNGTTYTSGGDGLTIDIALNQSNNWSWDSGMISWTTTNAPSYTVTETSMPDKYEFSSITDQIKSSTTNNFSSTLQSGDTYVTIYNKERNPNEGTIRVIKLSETDDLDGKTFSFRITVTGNFTYNGTTYTTDNPLVIEDTVNAVLSSDQATIENDTLKEYGIFSWAAGEEAPTYTVEEINIPEDASFVSISNNTKTVTNTPSITDTLSNDTVVIKMINRGIQTKSTQLQIVKETIGNTAYLDSLPDSEKTFTFTVELTGTFVYTAPDGTVTNVNNDTLTLNASVIGKGDTTTGNNVWTSGTITWNEDVLAPTYRVTEVNIPDYAEFVSWSNRTSTVETTFISGSLVQEQTNVLTAINDITREPQYGRIQISKRAQTDNISGDSFNFTLTVTGNFTYNGTEYTSENPYTTTIDIIADGDAWVSDVFSWEGETPTYTIQENLTEEQIADGVELVSIYNESQTNTNNSLNGSLKGSSDSSNPAVAEVVAINKKETKLLSGRLQITKEYIDGNGNEIDGVTFQFEVTVTYADGTSVTIPVEIESGTTWRSDYFYWESTESAPTYQIVETSSGNWSSSINPSSGSLEENEIITVTAINRTTSTSGQISITKVVEDLDKVAVTDYQGSFSFNVSVSGTFSYTDSNGVTRHFVNDTMSLKVTINIDGTSSATWTSGTFSWSGDAPTYAVEEVDIPTGWWLYDMTNSSGSLSSGGTVNVTCTNQTGPEIIYDLTMEMGGKVWDDTDYSAEKEADKQENGLIDEGEAGIEGVRVTITRVVSNGGSVVAELDTVYAYDENDHLTQIPNYTYTDSDGNWSFGAISVPAFNLQDGTESSYYNSGYDIAYNVTFSYDGQTYEPTTFLATSNGNASSYINATTSGRDAWLKDSMAIDNSSDRQSFNSKFETIEGDTPMDANGDTVGRTESGIELNYTSTDSISVLNSDNTRKISTLQTYDENGDIYSDFLINASTLNGGLTYPFDDSYHLESWDKTINNVTGLSQTTYHFSATYNYVLSINLGLLKREAADTAVEKDLTEAVVVINGKVLKYKYNSAIDLENPDNFELLYKQIAVADEQIEYTLGLYSSDYYYRASVYDTNSEVAGALDGFYQGTLNIPGGKASTELEIYLKYTINVYNESDTYDVRINEIADYYDGTFELITNPDTQSRTYVQTLNGVEINEARNLAESSTVTYYDSGNNEIGSGNVSWSNEGTLNGSDGITYNKITTNSLGGRTLSSGQRAEIQVTFKVNKDVSTDGNSIPDSIILGEKHNMAEVTSFSTYYSSTSDNKWSSPGQVAGRVDEDSAPDNINVTEFNDKTWYEDDTDSAPILTVELYGNNREVNGLVWEDAQTNEVQYSQVIGNGTYNPDEGDTAIADLTTEIVEVISIPTGGTDSNGNAVYQEYEFIWPTSTPIQALSNMTLEELTGFDSTIVTNGSGEYVFSAIPAGNYKVRFVYGDKDIATGNSGYSEVYNGQDYKSTSYEIGFDNDSDDDGYTDNEWHDLTNDELDAARVSDARDVEARRLYIASKSEMLVYDNTRIFATADDYDADHSELYGDYEASKLTSEGPVQGTGYYMYAETAKLNIEVENIYDINYTTETIAGLEGALAVDGDIEEGSVPTGNEFNYVIDNIDFGLEERSQTKLTLDKQIKQITLTTSDGNVILDAVYDISYELGDDDTIRSSVTLNRELSTGYENIASLNRSASSQGYRYIMAEGTILQGTTITVQYQLTVFNVGEADTANQALKDIWTQVNSEGYDMNANSAVNSAIERLSSPYYTAANGRMWSDLSGKYQYGTYFGSIYYLGTQGTYTSDNILVESTVHQIIDYVDPDVEFIDTNNISANQSWATATITDLVQYADEGLIDPAIIQIVDSETGEPIVVDEAGNIVTGNDVEISEVTYYNYRNNAGISSATYSELSSGLTNGTYKYSILSDQLQEYITDSKNNVIINIDNGDTGATDGTNPSLVKATTPYTADNNYDNATASINLTVSRYYSSEEDSSDIDNIAEIIKVENTVGRRDVRTIAANTSTYELIDGATGYDETIDIYTISMNEPDTSATEIITLSPPTGLDAGLQLVLQILAIVLVAGVILAVGIIVIKKKVLIKK